MKAWTKVQKAKRIETLQTQRAAKQKKLDNFDAKRYAAQQAVAEYTDEKYAELQNSVDQIDGLLQAAELWPVDPTSPEPEDETVAAE